MAPLDRPPDRGRARSRLRLVAAITVVGAVSLAAPPVVAAGAGNRAQGRAGARVTPSAKATLLPIEGAACLFPIPGQECSEEERRLCEAPPAPDPVVVDCHDPANAWVLEMVGECECDHLHLSGGHASVEREHERPHDASCLDSESCGASPSATAPLTVTLEYQPAIDRVAAADRAPERRLPAAPAIVRHHPGYARGIEHPPRA